jgi:hypothetical protein
MAESEAPLTYAERKEARCPECGTRGYLVLPGFGSCQTCLKLRLAALDRLGGQPTENTVRLKPPTSGA